MKIYIIRHEKVDMEWHKKYNSVSYDEDCNKYDISPVITDKREKIKVSNDVTIYISALSRTYETACKLFDRRDFIRTPLISEVPLKSFKDTTKEYPTWLWNIRGRLQWLNNNKRQDETKVETIKRANDMIKQIEQANKDCYLVTHGFFMRTLIKELEKNGYNIIRNNKHRISNLDIIMAEK